MSARCECECGKTGCHSRTYLPDGAHGTAKKYLSGCRCDTCAGASNRRVRDRRRRRQAESAADAPNRGKQWTGPELEIATRTDLTIREIAEMLGRTARGVRGVRELCANDPKFVALLGARTSPQ